MSQLFTEAIKDYYQQNTSLALAGDDGDLQLDGSIDSYTLTPVAPTASNDPSGIDFSTLTRITINVNAQYINTKDDTFNFERRFSFFRDFDQTTTDLSANEEAFVIEIFEQIIIDVFNASVANW